MRSARVPRPLPALLGRLLAAAALALMVLPIDTATADGPTDRRAPSVGYVYPAGGRQGTVVEVLVGGQNLRGVTAAHVSGEGVSASVLRHVRPLNNQQQRELRRRIAEVRAARRAATDAEKKPRRRRKKPKAAAKKTDETPRPELPAHPLFDRLDELSEEELQSVAVRFFGVERRKKQPNAQIAEVVEVQVEIAPGAAPGDREIRIETRSGLTNPIRFQVGDLPEVLEAGTAAARTQALAATPVVVNGQVLPGEVDRFRFRAQRGRRLVVAAAARDLVPFLADAVPGWFQATLCVRDAAGREAGFSDDFGFEPDPRLVFDVPHDGEYVVEIRDALYRGREDFVYRLSIGEQAPRTWSASARSRRADAPERRMHREVEPNDSAVQSEGLLPPHVVLGRIAWPGDEDFYVFRGRAGDDVVVEVAGRRLGSPIDAIVRLIGPAGGVLAWSDDVADARPGLLTHHADCYVRAELPADGAYTVQVADVRGHGSARHDYRLSVGPARPDFALAVTPSSLSVAAGRTAPFRVHVFRRDGFEGGIDVSLVDAPPGFVLTGGRVPAGRDSIRMTLTAPPRRGGEAVAVRVEGRARVADRELRREAVPADDRMQAFLYRHLVPAREWLVAVRKGRPAPRAKLVGAAPVRVPAEGVVRVELRVPGLAAATPLRARLDGPPEGITLAGTKVTDGSIALLLRAARTPSAVRETDNLIVEIFAVNTRGKGPREVSVGYLPAIPIELAARR